MTKERFSYVDLSAGIMILWMVLGHTCMAAGFVGTPARPSGITDFVPNFLFFFMPWFFYKSGQFFSKKGFKEELKKDWNKLIRQFLIWSAIGYISYLISLGVFNGLTFRNIVYLPIRHLVLGGSIDINHPLWFLLTLFGVRQIANFILPLENDKFYWLKCLSIVLVAFSVGFGLYCLDCRFTPIWAANGSTGLAYFTLGYCTRKHETKWWLLIPCILSYIVCCFLNFPNIDMHLNQCGSVSRYLMSLPASCAGIITFNLACRYISKYLHYLSLPFEYIGKYAMIIYVSHGVIYGSMSWIIDSLNYNISYTCALWLILGSYIIILPLLCYLSTKITCQEIK